MLCKFSLFRLDLSFSVNPCLLRLFFMDLADLGFIKLIFGLKLLDHSNLLGVANLFLRLLLGYGLICRRVLSTESR